MIYLEPSDGGAGIAAEEEHADGFTHPGSSQGKEEQQPGWLPEQVCKVVAVSL